MTFSGKFENWIFRSAHSARSMAVCDFSLSTPLNFLSPGTIRSCAICKHSTWNREWKQLMVQACLISMGCVLPDSKWFPDLMWTIWQPWRNLGTMRIHFQGISDSRKPRRTKAKWFCLVELWFRKYGGPLWVELAAANDGLSRTPRHSLMGAAESGDGYLSRYL